MLSMLWFGDSEVLLGVPLVIKILMNAKPMHGSVLACWYTTKAFFLQKGPVMSAEHMI